MRRVGLWAAVCVLACVPVARGMSGHDAENALRDSLVNQQLVLRNFSDEEKVRAEWNGSEIALDPPRWRAVSEVAVDSLKLKGHKLVMRCSRHIVVKDRDGQVEPYATPSKMEIDVELGNADPAAVLPEVKDALFYSSLDEALAALPKGVRDRVPGSAAMDPSKPLKAADASKPTCDCAMENETGCVSGGMKKLGVVPPVVVRQVNPSLTDESRRAGHVDAHVDLGFTVGKDGKPQDVWIVKPAGMGLDEAAAESVLQYVFRPAMCGDKPVAVYLMVDVRFQRF